MSLRIVMMGTGTFALPAFRAVCASRHEVVGLFTQPDRQGRGHHHHPHPMKEAAVELSVPVFQPENVNTSESLADLRSLEADLFLVAAYGQILKRELLDIPPRGAINIHASLLPRYRGAAPIQYAVRNGDAQTGVALFYIEPKLDSGPILGMESTPIGADETSGELHDRLAEFSVPLTLRVLDAIDAGTARAVEQSGEITVAPRIQKDEGIIDWQRSAQQVHDHIRGMNPWPKAWTWLVREGHDPLRVIVLKSRCPNEGSADDGERLAPGAIRITESRLLVGSGNGLLELTDVQPDGKRPMSAAEFLRGHQIGPNDRFQTV